MRILVLADIHSNWPALAAIDEDFDECVIVGDLVDYGTDPVPVIEWSQKHATAVIRGNHDHAVAQNVRPRGGNGYRRLAAASRPINWSSMSQEQMTWLARLPVSKHLTIGDMSFFLVHATPRDPMDEYLVNDPDAWRARLDDINADFVCVGHTHIPNHLDLGNISVVNPGSVGQPRDGDPRCSYAIIEDGRVELKRVKYNIDATVKQMHEAGMEREALKITEAVLRTGGKAIRNGRILGEET